MFQILVEPGRPFPVRSLKADVDIRGTLSTVRGLTEKTASATGDRRDAVAKSQKSLEVPGRRSVLPLVPSNNHAKA